MHFSNGLSVIFVPRRKYLIQICTRQHAKNLFWNGAGMKISDYRSSGIKSKAHTGTPSVE